MTTWQRQPTPNTCGQTCVAMLVGIPVADVLAEIPDSKQGTTAPQLIKFLRARGWTTSPRPRRVRRSTSPFAICRVRWGPPTEKRTHWVVFHSGRFFDPLIEGAALFNRHQNGRMISVIDCWPPETT